MLTSFQIERVAYLGDGEIVCRSCALEQYEEQVKAMGDEPLNLDDASWVEDDAAIAGVTSLEPLSRYTVEEDWPGGLWCDGCSKVIVEPDEDFCTTHEAGRAWAHGASRRWCDQAGWESRDGDGYTLDLDRARQCSFPEEVEA